MSKLDVKNMRCVGALVDAVPAECDAAEAVKAVEDLSALLVKGIRLGLGMAEMKSGFRDVIAKMIAEDADAS